MRADVIIERVGTALVAGALLFMRKMEVTMSPQAQGALIGGVFALTAALLALWQQRRSQRQAAEQREDDLRRQIEDRTRAAEEGMRVRLSDITENTMASLQKTIEVLAAERDRIATTASNMQTQMFASAAEVSRLTRENLAYVAQHASDEQLVKGLRESRTKLEEELGIVRAMLTEAQDVIKRGIIQVEREKFEASKPASKDRPREE